jgi:MHS family proline/betaine transporter-like MFS transporter
MAIFLNELFFPTSDPHTASLLAALAFCSTWMLRPFGALLFGWIGDNIGRKSTVIITTMMMAVSCLIMANLPTYAEIGISSAWIVTICRMLQGMSSMGEMKGAQIYLTEITKPPARYPIVALISASSIVGSLVALVLATLITTSGLNWRVGFWIGASVAIVGSVARMRLRETPEFIDMKRRMKKAVEDANHAGLGKAAELLKTTNSSWKEKVDKKTIFSYLAIESAWPVSFFFTYFYAGFFLKSKFGYTANQVISQNLIVTFVLLFGCLFFSFLSYKIHPIRILKFKIFVLSFFCLMIPPLLSVVETPLQMLFIQCLFVFFAVSGNPAYACFIVQFPIYKRFTLITMIFAIAAAIVHTTTSFGMIYLTDCFAHYGLWFIFLPMCVSFFFALRHFDGLEKKYN